MKELKLGDKAWGRMCLNSLSFCVYKPLGLSGIDGAPIVEGGTGFFVDINESRRYFFLTHHQYENCLKGTNICVSPHNGASVSGADLKLSATCVRNDLQGETDETLANDIFLKDIDIIALALSNTEKENIRTFKAAAFFEALRGDPSTTPEKGEWISIIGYPNKDNGQRLYEEMEFNDAIVQYTSKDWEIDQNGNYKINLAEQVDGNEDFNDLMQGFSGSPVVHYKLIENEGSKAKFEVSLVGIVTSIFQFEATVYAVPFKQILDEMDVSIETCDQPQILAMTISLDGDEVSLTTSQNEYAFSKEKKQSKKIKLPVWRAGSF